LLKHNRRNSLAVGTLLTVLYAFSYPIMRNEVALKSDDIAVELRVLSLIGVSVQNKEFIFVENVTITRKLHY
jgi:hypothetical protein